MDLSHIDDNENSALINGTLTFGPIIFMNYLSYNSLTLESTSDSPSGEGVVIDNNGPELICSAGIDVENLRQNIITLVRCLPDSKNPQENLSCTMASTIP
ncbi:hypothetical protein C2G38_2181537 [Gigaspora rosea]|uniref:Uncharacterized protein n=1 Tax=Gigaspora rosea TaxID=44941 RepID=A0A397VI82_9GLOM|nr:hypothetical protein C2G38_2181537 [Gigaspora rosea]